MSADTCQDGRGRAEPSQEHLLLGVCRCVPTVVWQISIEIHWLPMAETPFTRPPTHTCKSPACTLLHWVPFGTKGVTQDIQKWQALEKVTEQLGVNTKLRGRKSHRHDDGWRSQSKTNQYSCCLLIQVELFQILQWQRYQI